MSRSREYDRADQWRVISLGEKHGDIKLNRGAILCSMGKTTIEKLRRLSPGCFRWLIHYGVSAS